MRRTILKHSVLSHRRRGFSLIECLVYISLGGVAMGVSAMSIHELLRAERLVGGSVQQSLAISRLGDYWRNDADQARDWKVMAPASESEFPRCEMILFDGQKVLYAVESGWLIRDVQQGESRVSHEVFRLSSETKYSFEESPDRQIVTLKILLPAVSPENRAGFRPGAGSAVWGEVVVALDATRGQHVGLWSVSPSKTEAPQ